MHDAFETFRAAYAAHGYPVLFLGVLLENAGVPVPGETALIVAAYLASPRGGSHFRLGVVVVVACAAAILGDNLGYWLGRRVARPRINVGGRYFLLTARRFRDVENFFARYGAGTVFAARFVPGLRVIAGPAAGLAGMRRDRFLTANAAGAVAWSTLMSLLGYSLGWSLEGRHHAWTWGAWFVPGLILVWVAAHLLWRGLTKRTKPPTPTD